MRKFLSMTLAGAALAGGGVALAQPAPAVHPGVATDAAPPRAIPPADRAANRDGMRQVMFARLDTNHDGQISQAEFAAGGDRLAAMRGERGGGRFGGRGPDGPMARGPMGGGRGAMADTNRDGTVTRDEFAAAMLQRFDRIDANHDGKISPDERRGPMGGMPGRGPAPGGGG
ncbi:MAG: EF-hand domain-containing protein [Croceibacterium sp.]